MLTEYKHIILISKISVICIIDKNKKEGKGNESRENYD